VGIAAVPGGIRSSARKRAKKAIDTYGKRVIFNFERKIDRLSLLEGGPFYRSEVFPWARRIESRWRAIRAELDEVLADRDRIPLFHEIQAEQRRIAGDGKWRTFFLYAYGYKSVGNCARVPRTAELVSSIPGMSTAFFSILAPGKRIPPHRGPYKGVIRYHLALKVPRRASQCRIRVGDQWRHWRTGRSLVFDDTVEHEVRNDTHSERVVLFVDVLRPLPPVWDKVNRAVVAAIGASPYVRDAVKRQAEWERDVYGPRGGIERVSLLAA